MSAWQPISTAPRNPPRDILVFCPAKDPPRREIFMAWWAIPYENAPLKQGWWYYDGHKVMLSADVHDGLGATHWMELPDPPVIGTEDHSTQRSERVDSERSAKENTLTLETQASDTKE